MKTPKPQARTFLTRLFGRDLDDERYAVECFRSMIDGDIYPVPAGESGGEEWRCCSSADRADRLIRGGFQCSVAWGQGSGI